MQIATHGVQPDNPTLSHWIADLDRILAAHPEPDPSMIAGAAAADRLSLQVQAGLRAAIDVLGTPLPFSLRLLDPPSPAAGRDERARWSAAAQAEALTETPGLRASTRRFLSHGRAQVLRGHPIARLQVGLAVMATRAQRRK